MLCLQAFSNHEAPCAASAIRFILRPKTHQTGHNLIVTAAWVLVQGWGQLINLFGVLMLGLRA